MNRHTSNLRLSIQLLIFAVAAFSFLSLSSKTSHNGIKKNYTISFDGKVHGKKGSIPPAPLPFCDVYVEKYEPGPNYVEEVKKRPYGPLYQTDASGYYKVTFTHTIADNFALAKAQLEGAQQEETIRFWLGYVYHKRDTKGNILYTIFHKQFVEKKIIIQLNSNQQKTVTLDDIILDLK
jgi:hypothetical protein